MATVYLSLGSNLGNRQDNIEEAIWRLSSFMRVNAVSSLYDTAPLGDKDQPRFLNIALGGETALGPVKLLGKTQEVERQMGRGHPGHNLPRPIDIDILFYDSEVINTDELCIPHPMIAQRAFVLVPLTEIAPQLVHPVTHQTAKDMLARLSYPPEAIFKYRMEEDVSS